MRHPLTVPVGATAMRRTWTQLPTQIRAVIEDRLGAEVVEASTQGSGFTPGLASRLLLADGRRVFLKAADHATQGMFAEAYLEETRKLSALPRGVPAPRLLWHRDGDGWVVLCFEHIDGHPPRRPWQPAELTRVIEAVEHSAALLTPAPSGLDLPTWSTEVAGFLDGWESAGAGPWTAHGSASWGLARAGLAAGEGQSLVHCDLRDDNILVGANQIWFCDWNFPVLGAAWIDLLTVLISARGDGLDADALLASSALSSGLEADRIDAVLALLTGYFLGQGRLPIVTTSPWLRTHQQWYADVCWDWLAQRRGWE